MRTHRIRKRAIGIVALALAGAALLWCRSVPYDRAALDAGLEHSVRIAARDGTPLRTTVGTTGTRSAWLPLAELSPRLVDATLAAEDRRFFRHLGIDPLATARAALANLRARRVVEGGSTITQQLAGLLWPEARSPAGKLREAVRAVRLEIDFSKHALLEQYLNRLPYGAGSTGVDAGCRAWFDRSPTSLGASQAATLAALPQSPARYGSIGGREAWRARRDAILRAMEKHGRLAPTEAAEARARPLELDREPPPFAAPHFADWILATRPPALARAARIETTLDATLQSEVEGIIASQLAILRGRGVREMAAVVLRTEGCELLAMVGSPDWEASQVNGALALRQPGSALKPFVYALGFAAGLSPADVLADVPMAALDGRGGEVAPRNFDGRFHGPVRAREALASSFNVPAVRLLDRLGTERVLHGLRSAGLASLSAGSDRYGLGLVLGVGEVTLLELAQAYAGLARGGVWQEAVAVRTANDAQGRAIPLAPPASHRWLDPAAAFLTADVLSDDAARMPGFGARSILDLPFPVAVKTGTSTDFRNTWCVGFDQDHVVAVWAGNFDASPVDGLTGTTGCGPVFRSILLQLQARGSRPWTSDPPPDWRRAQVCALSGGAPGDACTATVTEWFAPGAAARRAPCTFHVRRAGRPTTVWPGEYAAWASAQANAGSTELAGSSPARIASPLDGSIYFRDPRLQASGIRIAAQTVTPSDVWLLDGRRLDVPPGIASFTLDPEPGTHRLELRRAGERAAVRFTVR